MKVGFSFSRLMALSRKETAQMLRDPSTVLVAFVLPVVLLLLFATAVSLDVKRLPVGVVLETDAPVAQELAAAFTSASTLKVIPMRNRHEARTAIIAAEVRGFAVIPADLPARLAQGNQPLVEIVTDGSQPNAAGLVGNTLSGVATSWAASQRPVANGAAPPVRLEPRYWFNPEIESRRALIPGAIAIVMTMIGTLLTALVVAREWERGTMEALLSTPSRVVEILAGKLIPYFVLGMAATLVCAGLAVFAFGVPMRGSILALLLSSAAFLVPALGQGLLISAATRNQFLASQVALFTGFLPAFLLSGFLFEISSMPAPIQAISQIVAARYFIDALRSTFLAGDLWGPLLANVGAMLLIGVVMFALAARATSTRLDGGRP
jgi:ABC-2 type transport system permease protein